MLSSVLTPLTHMLLRNTVRKWFEYDESVFDTRRKVDRMIGLTDPMPRGWQAKPAGMAGGGTLYRIEPTQKTQPIKALYFHGGGYSVGGLKTHGAFCARLARALCGAVMFVDYRLAPEHAFPAAFDDCCAAFAAVAAECPDLLLAGDSAGGGLALAVTQYGHSTLGLVPKKLLLLSPWLDMTLSGNSMSMNETTDSMLSAKILTRMRAAYLAGQDMRDPRASPILGELRELPPTLILASTTEVLRADSRRLKTEVDWLHGKAELIEYAGMPHIFPTLNALPASKRAIKQIAAFAKA